MKKEHLTIAWRVAVFGMLVLIYRQQLETEETADQARRHAVGAEASVTEALAKVERILGVVEELKLRR